MRRRRRTQSGDGRHDHATAIDTARSDRRAKKRLPPEVSILGVLIGIALVFEILGWIFVGDSFLANKQRLSIIILQVSVIGIIAVGVTQVIITAGVDLSSGSIVGLVAMVAASFAQTSTNARAVYPALTDMPADLADPGGLARRPAGRLHQRRHDRQDQDPALHRHAGHDGVGPRPGQMVHARPAGGAAQRQIHLVDELQRLGFRCRCRSSSSCWSR